MEIEKAIEQLEYDFNELYKAVPCDTEWGIAINESYTMAIEALKKQIPKKPVAKPYFEDIEEEYLCCPACGDILTDRILMDNKKFYFYCLNCGQKFD